MHGCYSRLHDLVAGVIQDERGNQHQGAGGDRPASMACSECGAQRTQVVASKLAKGLSADLGADVVKRRRRCTACRHNFQTAEVPLEHFESLVLAERVTAVKAEVLSNAERMVDLLKTGEARQ